MSAEQRIKHLEMIQANIARMAQNSFVLKGWAVTLTAALLVLAAEPDKITGAASLYFLPAFVFWLLDAYYLCLERRFRGLYERARDARAPLFSMELCDEEGKLWSAAVSRPMLLYAVLLVPAIALVLETVSKE